MRDAVQRSHYLQQPAGCARFDDLCVAAGRDPASIRHSVVCFPPLTPWQSAEYFTNMVGRFSEIGIDEFVLYWPQTWGRLPARKRYSKR